MTTFIDTHIPTHFRRELMDASYHYLANVAYPHDDEKRKRSDFISALIGADFKAVGRQIPPTLPRFSRKRIGQITSKALNRISARRIPAFRMLLQRFYRASPIDLPPPWLTPDQRERLLRLSAVEALVDPDGDLTGEGGNLISDERNLDNVNTYIWTDSLPALAMVCGLWRLRVFSKHGRQLPSLLTEVSWVPEAVADARAMALCIEHIINPPTLLVPRRTLVRDQVHRLAVHPRRFATLILPPRPRA